jgi:hypothetical protein
MVAHARSAKDRVIDGHAPEKRSRSIISAQDRTSARKLGRAILRGTDTMIETPAGARPKFDQAAERLKAPNGHLLARILISAAIGGAPRPSEYALVDPKDNKYYSLRRSVGPNWQPDFFQGPYDLPKGVRFKGGEYSAEQLEAIEKAGNDEFARTHRHNGPPIP